MVRAKGVDVNIQYEDYTQIAIHALESGAQDAIEGISDFLYNKLKEYFETGGTEEGAWEKTVLPTGKPPLGGVEGEIFKSIKVDKESRTQIEITVNHPYAGIHEYGFFLRVPGAGVEHVPPMIYKLWKLGYTWTSPSKPFIRIPARPFFAPSMAATRREFPRIARSYVDKSLRENLRTC